MGRKGYENLPEVGMRLYIKFEVYPCRNVSVMPGHTDRQTDGRTERQTKLIIEYEDKVVD